MTFEVWITYIFTVFIFLLSPGPSHIFMLSKSLSHGFHKSWATGAGDLTAHIWQISLASIGLVSVIYAFQDIFIVIKWAGVLFLVYLGIKQFKKKSAIDASQNNKAVRKSVLFGQGFAMSSSNPKAVVFFAALFPQFINTAAPTTIQFVILGLTYIVIDGCFLLFYGCFAQWCMARFKKHIDKYLNKLSGALLIASAVMLGLKDVKE